MAGRDARQLYVQIIGDDRQLTRTYKNATAETTKFDKKMSQTVRGVAAGSGAFKALGRSIAFASGGFLAAASVSDILRGSIAQASEAEAVQRKLAAQFQASGQDLRRYQQRIDAATNSLSQLAGIEDDELKQAFVTAFRGTNNVSNALKIQAIAADVARGRNIDLQTATLALTKAYAGQTAGLRRLGIVVPTALRGMEALRFVQERFRGQAEAGTTAQERFSAAFANFEEAIGKGVLPVFEDLMEKATKYLQNQDNQKRVQKDTNALLKTGAFALDILSKSIEGYTLALGPAIEQTKEAYKRWKEFFGLGGQGGLRGPVGTPGERTPGLQGPIGRPAGPMSMQGQMNQLELRLAQALTTVSRADDRAILVLQKHLIERWLAHTKDWKLRRQLYQQLGSVQSQITSIDDDKAQAAQDAAEKEKEAKQKERDAEKKRLETHRDHIRKMRAAWQEQLAKIRQATEAVRSEFGAMPFQPTPAGILGVRGQTAGGFAGAYANQTRTFVRFYNSLTRLSRMGAPAGLVEQLRGLGPSGAGVVQGLISHPGQLRQVIRAFRQREQVVQQIAKADINARYVTINVAGNRAGTTAAASRRGPRGGVPVGGYPSHGSPW